MPCPKFPNGVFPGYEVHWQQDGFHLIAEIENDSDSDPHEFDQPGCCFDTSDPEHGEQNKEYLRAWLNDEWFYCTVIVTAYRVGIKLGEATLSSVDANFPNGRADQNWYLSCVADELAPEAIKEARDTLRALGCARPD